MVNNNFFFQITVAGFSLRTPVQKNSLTLMCRYKYNGGNFHVRLPARDPGAQNVSVPEDLVQVQAYLRWERNGKQMYSPDQEKVSFHPI